MKLKYLFSRRPKYKRAYDNFKSNRVAPIDGIIHGQMSDEGVKDLHFSKSKMGKTGCGIIAIYNSMLIMGIRARLAKMIWEFELYNQLLFGHAGSNPFAFSRFFKKHSIDYRRFLRSKSLNSSLTSNPDANPQENKIIVMTIQNNRKKLTSGFHTFAATYSGGKFAVYNRYGWDKDLVHFNTLEELLGKGRFLTAYVIEKRQ